MLKLSSLYNISVNAGNFSTDINASVILVGVMDFTDVPMLKIWSISIPILILVHL